MKLERGLTVGFGLGLVSIFLVLHIRCRVRLQLSTMASDSEIMEDTTNIPTVVTDVSDGSCITQYIEIVPHDCASDGYCTPECEADDIKKEELQNLKTDPMNKHDEVFSDFSVKVRIQFLIILQEF